MRTRRSHPRPAVPSAARRGLAWRGPARCWLARLSSLALVGVLAWPRTTLAAPVTTTWIVEDAQGQRVAQVVVRDGSAPPLSLPPGRYVLVAADGDRREVVLDDGEPLQIGSPPPSPAAAVDDRAAPGHASADAPAPAAAPSRTRRGKPRDPARARAIAAPLSAIVIPGVGHAVARRPAPAFGIFAGAAVLGFAAFALHRAAPDREGAALGDASHAATREALRQGAFTLATDTLALLWIGQIADAWVAATGHRVRARRDHVVAVSLQRATTVGLRPGAPTVGRYDELSLGVVGQVIPKLWFGLSDLSLHFGRGDRRVSVQAGLRVAGRVLERRRFWLVVAAGAILQGTSARSSRRAIADDATTPVRGMVGSTVWAQLESRIFVLDRLSFTIAPRLSLPLATRMYGADAALPRFAPALELVVAPEVYF
ncbi:MAG: hypothetical protein IPH07_05275 [Deltaproteobacteria bacterium]|nr:hypothetical protein [Deltaproteobacteria bacterium]MBK8719535.1 hypothetical protein [Deltaproteobacteria bacterium]